MTMNWVDHPLARPAAPAVPEAIEAGFTHTAAGEVRDRAARGFEAAARRMCCRRARSWRR